MVTHDVKVICPICGAPNWVSNEQPGKLFKCCHCKHKLKTVLAIKAVKQED